MTVDQAIAKDNGSTPKPGMVGKAWADWCDVGTIDVRSGKLTAADFGMMDPASGVTVKVAKGPYRVQARIMSFGGSLGISAARALPESLPQTVRGRRIGEVYVDIAKIAIADVADAAQGLTDEDFREIGDVDIWQIFGRVVTIKLSSKTIRLPCIASGFGDGSYPARAFKHGGKTVGIEVEFVEDGHVFGND